LIQWSETKRKANEKKETKNTDRKSTTPRILWKESIVNSSNVYGLNALRNERVLILYWNEGGER